MPKLPDLRETIPLPKEVSDAAIEGKLIFFVGAGVSRLAGYPSWSEFAYRALEQLREASLLNYSELDQLKTLDARTQLSVADSIATENKHSLNFKDCLRPTKSISRIYEYINRLGCPFITTNYDKELNPNIPMSSGSTTTASITNRYHRPKDFLSHKLDSPNTVIHLHGMMDEPDGMIIKTRDYLQHYDNEHVQEFLTDFFKRNTVVFLGYGLQENEILEHILRRGDARSDHLSKRFTIQGFYASQNPLQNSLQDYYRSTFGVSLLGFLRDHQDYNCLEGIMRNWSEDLIVNSPTDADSLDLLDEVLADE